MIIDRRGFIAALGLAPVFGKLPVTQPIQQLLFHKDAFALTMAPFELEQPVMLTYWHEVPFALRDDELASFMPAAREVAQHIADDVDQRALQDAYQRLLKEE